MLWVSFQIVSQANNWTAVLNLLHKSLILLSGLVPEILYITQTRPCNIQQYLTAEKNVHFQMKTFNIFLIFAQNIDCGYTLEPRF